MNSLLSILISIATVFSWPFTGAVHAPQSPTLGAAPSPAALSTYNLAGSGVSSSASSITLQSLTIKQTGQLITTANLAQGAGDKFYATLDPGSTSRQEIAGCTGVTQNSNGTATLTGCSRGLSPVYPYAASTTLRFVHAGGSQVVFGDAPQLFNDFKAYIDTAVVSGAVDSSPTAKGIVEKATGNEAASHALTGSGDTTAPLGLTTDVSSSTRTTNTAQVMVSSSTDGYLDPSYLNPTVTKAYTVSGATTTLATTTILSYSPMLLLASSSLSAANATVTVSNLPRSLSYFVVAHSEPGTTNNTPSLIFNADGGSNYIDGINGKATKIILGAGAGTTTSTVTITAPPGQFKTIQGSTLVVGAAGTSVYATSTGGVWNSAATITRMDYYVTAPSGNMGAGSFINVYGNPY